MSDHQKFVALATRLITKHGREVTFKVLSGSRIDPGRPWVGLTSEPKVLATVKAVFIPFRGFEFATMFEDDDLFKNVTELCLVAGGQGILENAHVIQDADKNYKIEITRRFTPGDQTIIYAFGVTR